MGDLTKQIMRCVSGALNAKKLEECHAYAEAAECAIEDLERDAARYRYIRNTDELPPGLNLMALEMVGEKLDAAVDAAMANQHSTQKRGRKS